MTIDPGWIMLETLQTNNYRINTITELNDNLLYLDYIDSTYEFKQVMVDPSVAYRHQGNFVGLLKDLGVDIGLYHFTMYLNGINNPVDYDGKLRLLKLPIKPPIPAR